MNAEHGVEQDAGGEGVQECPFGDHDTEITHEDETGIYWTCRRCGAEGFPEDDDAGATESRCLPSGCTCSCHGLMGGHHAVPCCDRSGLPRVVPPGVDR